MTLVVAPGSINVDLILRTDVCKGPKTFRGDYRESQGGKGSNQALAGRRARGLPVTLVGAVGDDAWGQRAIEVLDDSGVDVQHVRRGTTPTGVVMEYLYADGEVTIGLAPGANDTVAVADVDAARAVIEGARVLLTQLETPLDAVAHALTLARAAGTATILDPSVVPSTPADRRRLFDEILPLVDVLAPNRSEAFELTGIAVEDDASARRAAAALREHVAVVLLTRGPGGAMLSRCDDAWFLRGHTVDGIDGGAAGDTFRGAFAADLAQRLDARGHIGDLCDDDWLDAARVGNAAAALCVTRRGAAESIPLADDIAGMLARPAAVTRA